MPTVQLTERDRIVETANQVHFERHPEWSVDEMLLHPRDMILFCEEVRVLLHWKPRECPDEHILRTYLNARKQGRLRKRAPASKPRRRPKT